jgi:hypothetical protein
MQIGHCLPLSSGNNNSTANMTNATQALGFTGPDAPNCRFTNCSATVLIWQMSHTRESDEEYYSVQGFGTKLEREHYRHVLDALRNFLQAHFCHNPLCHSNSGTELRQPGWKMWLDCTVTTTAQTTCVAQKTGRGIRMPLDWGYVHNFVPRKCTRSDR